MTQRWTQDEFEMQIADMIDINELRRLTVDCYWPTSPVSINEILDRLEEAESDGLEQARLNGMGASREAALMAKLEAVEKERESWKGLAQQFGNELDTVRAKIERMERQGPVEWQTRTRPAWNDGTWGPWRKCSEEYAEDIKKTPLLHDWLYEARALYALPGAKGEEK